MTKEGNFIIFAIEQYKKAMKLQGKEVVELFKKYNISHKTDQNQQKTKKKPILTKKSVYSFP
jgi:hypothetical protein